MKGVAYKDYLRHAITSKKTVQGIFLTTNRICNQCIPLTESRWIHFVNELFDSGHSEASVNKYIQALKHYSKWKGTKNLEWAKNVRRYKETIPDRIPFSKDQIDNIIDCRPEKYTDKSFVKWKLFWRLLAYHPFRPKELLYLQKDHIVFEMEAIRIIGPNNKGKKGRLMPIEKKTWELLVEYIKGLRTNYVFPSQLGDKPMDSNSYLRDFRKRRVEIGFSTDIKPYNLKHSVLTRLGAVDGNIVNIKSLAGHSDIRSTLRYIHENFEAMKSTLKKDPYARENLEPEEIIEFIEEHIKSALSLDKRFDKEKIHQAIAMLYKSIKKK